MDTEERIAYLWDEKAVKKGRNYIPEKELSGTQMDLMLQDERYVWMRCSGRTQQPYGELQLRREELDVDALALASHEEFEDDQRKVHVPDPDHVCDDNDDCEFHEYQGPKQPEQGDEPTMEDLRGLTVAKLQELADKEQVDLTGLKLKDDILGRMAAHFGLDPAS